MPKAKTSPKQNKLKAILTSKKWRPVLFVLIIAVVGGGYMLYRSYAYIPVSAMYASQGELTTWQASKISRGNIQTVLLKPGGSVTLNYYPLTTGRYDLCVKARATSSVKNSLPNLVMSADNSNNALEQANGYSQYSIRIISPEMKVPFAKAPLIKKGATCTRLNYAVYGNRGIKDPVNPKSPRIKFTAPFRNKTDIEIEAVVVAYSGGLDGR